MARITPSALVDDIKGSVGGVAFSSWKGNTTVRSKARSVSNLATEAQAGMRDALGYFTKRYFDDLTDGQRAEWDQFAQEMAGAERADKVQGGFGKRVVPKRQWQKSGHGWYVGINVRFIRSYGVSFFRAPIDDAPLGQTPPSQPMIVSVVYDSVNGRFKITFKSPQDFGHANRLRIEWWIKPNWGKARLQKGVVSDVEGQDFVTLDVVTLSIPRGLLTLPLPDGSYAFQLDAVGKENGLVSPPSNIVIVQAKFVGPAVLFPEDFMEGGRWPE